jgi:hypothetical protein
MSTRRIQDRLKKLEAALPPRPTKQDKVAAFFGKLRGLAIAYYLGDPQLNEAIIQAYERALGIGRLRDTSPAMTSERDAVAFDRLLEKFGASRSDDWDTLIDAFKRMANGFSEGYKDVLEGAAREFGIEWPST